MKKLFLLFPVFFVSVFCFSNNSEESFLQANKFYRNREYKKAFDLYDSIERKGPAVWYDMGNCLFKMNEHLDALVCWKRAQNGASAFELNEIRKNISIVNEILGRTKEQSFFNEVFSEFINRFSLFVFQFTFLLFWFSLFIFVWFFKKIKKLILVILLPVNILFGLATFMKYKIGTYESAIIRKDLVSLFSGPDENYQIIGKVNFAHEVKILEKRDHWCKVKVDGLAGWILADKLEIV